MVPIQWWKSHSHPTKFGRQFNQHQASIHVCVWKVGQFRTKTLICFLVVMPEGVVGIAILSLLTGAALNSMASGLVSDTNAAAFLVSEAWGAWFNFLGNSIDFKPSKLCESGNLLMTSTLLYQHSILVSDNCKLRYPLYCTLLFFAHLWQQWIWPLHLWKLLSLARLQP